jgi:hypothetical protein
MNQGDASVPSEEDFHSRLIYPAAIYAIPLYTY